MGGTALWRADVYAGARHLETYTGAIYLDHQDHLGTDRVRGYQSNRENSTSLPFGDSLTWSNVNISAVNFTGQRRDPESGLDDFTARHYGSSLGRFMSPDPENAGASLDAPQSSNAYSYVLNNPLNAIDPDGRGCVYLDNNGGTNPSGPGGFSVDNNSSQSECDDMV